MKRTEIVEILDRLSSSYPNFGDTNSKIKYWEEDLKYYSYNDVKERINELMQTKEFSQFPPTLSRIIATLTKTNEKIENSEIIYYCQFCRRNFDDRCELNIHEDRCKSVQYIIKQYKKYDLGEVDKKVLYNLPEKDFNARYMKLLRIIHDMTDSSTEKKVIECIFNPPNQLEAKSVIQQGIGR